MKVVSVDKKDRYYWKVIFSRDGEEVSKNVRLGDCARAVYRASQYDEVFMHSLQRAAREADRDIAFKRHGKAFREHCEFKSNFWELLPEHELAKLSFI